VGDPRVEAYASLLVERCIGAEPGWQVLIRTTPIARPLLDEVVAAIARREAYAPVRLTFSAPLIDLAWAREASDELLAELPAIDRYSLEQMDGFIAIDAPENTRDPSELSPERYALFRRAVQPLLARAAAGEIPWVRCVFPCPALAQEAGMSLEEFEDFVYGACLLDWDEEGRKMERIAERFDRAREIRIVADDTELTLGVEGRECLVDAGHNNMPGGEVFLCPLEDSVDGAITFGEFPAVHQGHEVEAARLVFREGKVVEASARRGEEVLLGALETDDGARMIGELGIGCNPGIRRHMKNTLFDEKIYGTIHLAVGKGIVTAGGRNESALHWDIVKDLRNGGRLFCDDELVQESGEWTF
jgi:aminopeptidase